MKVTATISTIVARPVARTRRIRLTSSVVLPVPAAASTTSVSSRSSAIARRAALRRSVSGRAVHSARHRIDLSASRSASRSAALRFDALFFARTADRTEVAPRAGALGRRGGEEPVLDGAVDDRQHLQALPARVVVDRDLRARRSRRPSCSRTAARRRPSCRAPARPPRCRAPAAAPRRRRRSDPGSSGSCRSCDR